MSDADRALLEKFKKLLKIAHNVEQSRVAKVLGLSKDQLLEKLMDWGQFLPFKIEDDTGLIVVDDFDGFLGALDQQFATWGSAEQAKDGKLFDNALIQVKSAAKPVTKPAAKPVTKPAATTAPMPATPSPTPDNVIKDKIASQNNVETLQYFSISDMANTIGPDTCAVILRGIVAGCPILLVDTFDLYNRVNEIISLLKDMGSEELKITCEKITKDEMKDKKKRREDDLIIVPLYKAIMRSPFKETTNTRFEVSLLRETTQLPDRNSQIIFLRRELVKFTKIIDKIVKMLTVSDRIYEEDIPAFIKETFNTKFDIKNIYMIKDIITVKYGEELAQKIIKKSQDKSRRLQKD